MEADFHKLEAQNNILTKKLQYPSSEIWHNCLIVAEIRFIFIWIFNVDLQTSWDCPINSQYN